MDEHRVGTKVSGKDGGTEPGAGVDDAGTFLGSSCAAPSPSLELPAYGTPIGTPPYEIDSGSGLAVAWQADLARWAGSITTDRNGTVELAADGSFTYLPPGGEDFWGDDRFVLGDAGAQSPVRLTVQPRGLDLTALDPADSLPGTGAAYVVFGKVDTGPIALSSLEGGEGTAGFAILGLERDDGAGERVSGAADVNGDGLDDVIVGARRASPADLESAGSAYVVFGKADSTPVNLSGLEELNLGFAVHGTEANAQVGRLGGGGREPNCTPG